MVTKLTLNGPGVPARMAAMTCVIAGAGSRPTPSEPSAPALLTATARSGVMPMKAMPAWAIGVLKPYASVNLVRSSMPSTMSDPARPSCHPADSWSWAGSGCAARRGRRAAARPVWRSSRCPGPRVPPGVPPPGRGDGGLEERPRQVTGLGRGDQEAGHVAGVDVDDDVQVEVGAHALPCQL